MELRVRRGLGMKSGVQSLSSFAWALAASTDPGVSEGVTTTVGTGRFLGRPGPTLYFLRGLPRLRLPLLRVVIVAVVDCVVMSGVVTGGVVTVGVVTVGCVVLARAVCRDLLFSSVA